MRYVGMTAGAVLFAALAARAQPPGSPAPPVPSAADSQLDAHLGEWEKFTSRTKSLYTELKLEKTEAVFKTKQRYTGRALCMKPNLGAIRVEQEKDKGDYEAYLCTGKAIYQYDASKKTVTEFKLTPAQGAGGGNVVLDLLSGMKAAAIKQRFQVTPSEDDRGFVYFDIKPILPKDRQEFQHIRFALYGPRLKDRVTPYLPAGMAVLKPNGDKEEWTFSRQQPDAPDITEAAFQFKQISDWQFKQAPPSPAATKP